MEIAVIAAAYNEEDLVHQFIHHYLPFADRIFLLDNESTDRTAEIASKFSRVEVRPWAATRPDFNVGKHAAIEKCFWDCVGAYDYAFLVDVDEFVSVLSGTIGVRETLKMNMEVDVHKASGYHMVGSSAPYVPEMSIVPQFRRGIPSDLYSKPCIIRPSFDTRLGIGIHDVHVDPSKETRAGLFRLMHIPGPTEEIYVRRRMRNESRRMLEISRRTEDQIRAEYRKFLSSDEIVEVI